MKQPGISIIIPTYNRAHCIEVTLQSVSAQTYFDWECLVVDDGSTDDTAALISKWVNRDSRFQYHTRSRLPKGAPTCRNIGLENAQGSYVIFLDSDDYLLPHCLEERVNEIIKYPDYDFLVFPMAIKKKNVEKIQKIPPHPDYLIPFLSAKLPWSIVCPIWKTSTLIEAKGFKEDYSRFNDPELMIRILVKSDIKYKVYNDAPFDSVIIPSPKVNIEFVEKVFNSLTLLITDVTKELEQYNKRDFKYCLAGYLHLWFNYIFIPSKSKNPKQSIQLLFLFYSQDIISFRKLVNLMTRLIIYLGTSLFMKHPIYKLKDRAIYFRPLSV